MWLIIAAFIVMFVFGMAMAWVAKQYRIRKQKREMRGWLKSLEKFRQYLANEDSWP